MTPVIATINHLLAQEPWARQQLALHAGKLACIDTGAVALRLRVDSAGMLEAAPADMPANSSRTVFPALACGTPSLARSSPASLASR